jgi:hypothetical protein
MNDDLQFFEPMPFWFIDLELAAELMEAELAKISALAQRDPQIRSAFDSGIASSSQRQSCFELLAHRKVVEIVGECFLQRHVQHPELSKEQSNAVTFSNDLVNSDAPDWVLQMTRTVDRLAVHLRDALPSALHIEGYSNDPFRTEAIQSAKDTLSTVEEVQNFIEKVLTQQFERLAGRWSIPSTTERRPTTERKRRRTRDKQRVIRDQKIAEIDDCSPTISEFLRLMDERKVPPQPTWKQWPVSESWIEAYKNPQLRDLIHKDKSRAIKRHRDRHPR